MHLFGLPAARNALFGASAVDRTQDVRELIEDPGVECSSWLAASPHRLEVVHEPAPSCLTSVHRAFDDAVLGQATIPTRRGDNGAALGIELGRHAGGCPPFRCGLVSWSLPWEDQQAHHSLEGEDREPPRPPLGGFA